MSPNSRLDFGSIDCFARLIGVSQSAIGAAIDRYVEQIPEPSSTLMLTAGACWIIVGPSGIRRRVQEFKS